MVKVPRGLKSRYVEYRKDRLWFASKALNDVDGVRKDEANTVTKDDVVFARRGGCRKPGSLRTSPWSHVAF